jgi:hypothetical protein
MMRIGQKTATSVSDPDSNGSADPDPGRPKKSPKIFKINFMFKKFSVGLEASPGAMNDPSWSLKRHI